MRIRLAPPIAFASMALVALAAACGSDTSGAGGAHHAKTDGGAGGEEKEPSIGAGW